MQFYNRLTGQTQKNIPDYLLMGQWQLLPESTERETATVNGVPVSSRSTLYISPDATRCFRVHLRGNATSERVFPSWQIPSDLLLNSLHHFDDVLNRLSGQSEFWEKWVNTLPLVNDIEENVSPQLLEQLLEKHIGHLEEICHRPRTYLKMETDRLPISRAQRISPHATDFLAAHTEDWEKRTFRSIRPKRILCLIREDLLDIYENRVTVRLIEHLLEYLQQRINDVETLQRELEQADDFSRDIDRVYWRNRNRICSLWGEQFQAETALKTAEETLKLLRQLQYKLRGLLDTELYRAIPQQAKVGSTLKRTNILVNDQHYRYVDRLWNAWDPWKRGHTQTPHQLIETYQKGFKGFAAFCFLVVSRALTGNGTTDDRGLGFEFDSLHNSDQKISIKFNSTRSSITLEQHSDGVLLLEANEIRPLKLVPLMLPLTATDDVNDINTACEELSAICSNDANVITVILYLGTGDERQELLRQKVSSFENSYNVKGQLALVPISPLDIFSIERIAHVIQWWFCNQYCQIYPFTVEEKIPETLLRESSWLLQDGKQTILHKPPQQEEQDTFNKNLSILIRQTESRGRQARGDLDELKRLSHFSHEAKDRFKPLLACPTCYQGAKTFKELDGQCFRCDCQDNKDCGTNWGVRICNQCNQRYPYIQLSDSNIHILAHEVQTGLIERVFGRNALASPCINNRNESSFVCPDCGVCS